MTPRLGDPPRRGLVSAEDAAHCAVFMTMALSLATYAASGGSFGAGRVMAVVLAGLAVSGCVVALAGLRRGPLP